MDDLSFDRLARVLGSAVTRRAGFGAAIAALLPAAAAGRGHGRRGKGNGKDRAPSRDPRPEGPCGDGSRKDNVCTKDSQCCTNLCNKKIGKKNLDGKGRCRCLRRGKKCKSTSNCCKHLTCSGGVCGGGGISVTGANGATVTGGSGVFGNNPDQCSGTTC